MIIGLPAGVAEPAAAPDRRYVPGVGKASDGQDVDADGAARPHARVTVRTELAWKSRWETPALTKTVRGRREHPIPVPDRGYCSALTTTRGMASVSIGISKKAPLSRGLAHCVRRGGPT
jgi:hypothetical protein